MIAMTLFYEVRGSGPMLLISQSGEGDAHRSADLVDQLVSDYTVITYDRRGLSRSVLDDPAQGVRIEQHADDVHRLLAHLTDEPVAMLGCSLGALIGLHVAARHPGQLSVLIAHEPVAPWLLPDPARTDHRRELADIQDHFRRDGWKPAITSAVKSLGIGAGDVEPDLTPQPMTPQRIANIEFWLTHEFTAIIDDALDLDVREGPRIVAAAGRTTPRHIFDYRCAEELAALLGTDLVEFPGGHNGNTSHPRAYAAQLRHVLEKAEVRA